MHASVPAEDDGPATEGAALEAARHRFISRNLDRCFYLRVQVERDLSGRRFAVARFTLRDDRAWHHVEALLPPAGELDDERIEAAFLQLDAGIGAVRIAKLFSPPGGTGEADGQDG